MEDGDRSFCFVLEVNDEEEVWLAADSDGDRTMWMKLLLDVSNWCRSQSCLVLSCFLACLHLRCFLAMFLRPFVHSFSCPHVFRIANCT